MTYWGILTLVFTLIHNAETAKTILYITGIIFAAKQYKLFAYTPGGMHYLLIPATHLEKLICNIVLTIVYFFTMFLITYSIGNIIGSNLYNLINGTSNPVSWNLFSTTYVQLIGSNINLIGNNIDLPGGNVFLSMIVKFLTIQSIFMLGSVYFKRNAIGKTLLTLIAFFIIIGMIELYFLKGLFAGVSLGSSTLLLDNFKNGFNVFSYLLIPFLCIVTYFRLTEKQV